MSSCSNKKTDCNIKCNDISKVLIIIVKIQKSIHTTSENQQALIYNEDRSVLLEVDLTKHIENLLNGDLKAYFNATVDNDGLMTILPGQLDNIDW
jgi:hypothetical protein